MSHLLLRRQFIHVIQQQLAQNNGRAYVHEQLCCPGVYLQNKSLITLQHQHKHKHQHQHQHQHKHKHKHKHKHRQCR